MAVRRESVQLSLEDAGFSTGMAKDAAATALLRRELDDLSGSAVRTRKPLTDTSSDVDQVGKSAGKAGPEIDRLSGRFRILADIVAVLGPGMIPIAAVGAPAIAGMAASLGAGAIAGGSLLTAMVGVGDAIKAVHEADLDPTAANLEKAEKAMAALGPDARHFVREFEAFRPTLTMLRDQAALGWFPGLSESLDHLEVVGPRVAEILEAAGEAGGQAVADGTESLTTGRWSGFFSFVTAEMPDAISSLAKITGDLTHGAASMWIAFDPSNDKFLGWVEDVADGFDDWATSTQGQNDIAGFLDYVDETGPDVLELFLSLVNALTQLSQAAAPLGGPVLDSLTAVADVLAAIADSDLGTPIFTAISALTIYNRLLKTTAAIQAQTAANAGRTGGFSPAGAVGGFYGSRASSIKGASAGIRENVATIASIRGTAGAMSERDAARLSAAQKDLAANTGRVGLESARAAAPIAGLALATSGLAEDTGLANTASLALIGSVIPGYGAAIGGTVGLVMDAAAANNDLYESLSRVGAAMSAGSLAAAGSEFSAAQSSASDFRNKVQQDGVGWSALTDPGAALANTKNEIEGWFGDSDIEEQEAALASAQARMESMSQATAGLAAAMGLAIGPVDGSAASLRELDAVAVAAQPRMDELRVTQDELTAAYNIQANATGKNGAVMERLWSGVPGAATAYDDLKNKIAGVTDAAGEDTSASKMLADATDELAAANDRQAAAIARSVKQMRNQAAAANSAFDAETRWGQAVSDAEKQAKKGEKGLNRFTEAGRRNRAIVSEMSDAWAGQSAAVRNNADRYDTARKKLTGFLEQINVSPKRIKKLTDSLLEVPASVVTKAELRDEKARAAAKQLSRDITDLNEIDGRPQVHLDTSVFDSDYARTKGRVHDLDGDNATITITTVHRDVRQGVSAAVSAQGGVQQANGGLFDHGWRKAFADGGFGRDGRYYSRTPRMVQGGADIRWGEQETGWEAYISGKPGMRGRNVGIMREAGRRLGVGIRDLTQPARPVAGGTHPVPASFGGSGGHLSIDVGPIAIAGTLDSPFGPVHVEGIARDVARAEIDADQQFNRHHLGG